MRKLKVVAIDPSYHSTGFCCIEFDDKKYLVRETFVAKMENNSKLKTFKEEVFKKINKLNYINIVSESFFEKMKPDLIVIEGYSFMGMTNLSLQAEVTSAILLAVQKYIYNLSDSKFSRFNLLFIQPTQLKKYISNFGSAKKELILKQVYKDYGFDTNDNNIADSFALAILGRDFLLYNMNKEKKNKIKIPYLKLNSYKRKVLKNLCDKYC